MQVLQVQTKFISLYVEKHLKFLYLISTYESWILAHNISMFIFIEKCFKKNVLSSCIFLSKSVGKM